MRRKHWNGSASVKNSVEMGSVEPREYSVLWTGEALDRLAELLEGAPYAEGNPGWVERKYRECVKEGIHRLSLFPDLRVRYTARGFHCNTMALRSVSIKAFFRLAAPGQIVIFDCDWAARDKTGPQE
jgi:hypothetical protein